MLKRKSILLIITIISLVFASSSVMMAKDTEIKLLTKEEVKIIIGEKDGYDIPASIESDKISKEERMKVEKESIEKEVSVEEYFIDILPDEDSLKRIQEEKEKLDKEAEEYSKKHVGKIVDIKPSKEEKNKYELEKDKKREETIKILNKNDEGIDKPATEKSNLEHEKLVEEIKDNPVLLTEKGEVGEDIPPDEDSIERSKKEFEDAVKIAKEKK